MNDQAQSLREKMRSGWATTLDKPKLTRTITITSGKGGVGKSNFTLNFALQLQRRGARVLIFDADIGLANIDVLMGIHADYSLYHLLTREKTIHEIIQTGPEGVMFIAGGSGFSELLRLSDEQLAYFENQIQQLNGKVDYIIFDTGAGLSRETLQFIVAAQETFVVTTPEPTAITDAYALIKMVRSMNYDVRFKLIVNRVINHEEGRQTAEKIGMVAERFLDMRIPALGYIVDDSHVAKAVRRREPFSLAYPNSAASQSISRIADIYLAGHTAAAATANGLKGFLHRMKRLLRS